MNTWELPLPRPIPIIYIYIYIICIYIYILYRYTHYMWTWELPLPKPIQKPIPRTKKQVRDPLGIRACSSSSLASDSFFALAPLEGSRPKVVGIHSLKGAAGKTWCDQRSTGPVSGGSYV